MTAAAAVVDMVIAVRSGPVKLRPPVGCARACKRIRWNFVEFDLGTWHAACGLRAEHVHACWTYVHDFYSLVSSEELSFINSVSRWFMWSMLMAFHARCLSTRPTFFSIAACWMAVRQISK